MELAKEFAFSLLQEPGKSGIAGHTGDSILSDNEEERGILGDVKQNVLPEAHSPDWEAASLQRQQKAACNKPPCQKRGLEKLALITDGQKPHTEEKPYKCAECGKGFKGHSRLLNHLQTHIREKMFECIECGKSFSRKANLAVHQRVHTGEKPYQCKECDKTFSRTSNLIAHRKTHAKKKAFSCTTCKTSFSGCAALFQHQRVHMDEKPYRCTECGNSFRLCSNFIKHQRIHLRERPSEHTADANRSEFTSLHHKEEQRCGAEKHEMDPLSLVHGE
ncbi:PREDICTED: zinc finger protein 271-like, partial [Chlamydotis macqueenii]|uniref:zinc finger protein 271-like n=1 Tax=Chlamydotis macqueenii TaxID=187382 RepID=UPI000529D57A